MKKIKGSVAVFLAVITLMSVVTPAQAVAPGFENDLSKGAASAKVSLKKSKKSKKIKLSKASATIKKGKKLKLKLKSAKASKVKWSVKNKKIASVKKGKIKAKKAGSTVITAKYKKKLYKCRLIVFSAKKLGSKKVTAKKHSAKIKGIKVNFCPMMFKKKATATIKKISGLPKLGKAKMKVYDFSIKNAKVTNNDVALISIPYKAKKGKIPVAGYFNTKKSKWESVPCDYNGKSISIVANHFSPYGVGEISSPLNDYVLEKNTTRAFVLECWVPRTPSITGERAVQIMSEAMQASAPTTSCLEMGFDAANQLFDYSINWGANFTSAFGFTDKFTIATGNLAKELGAIGFALSYVSAVRYAINGDHYQAASTAFQGTLGLGTGLGFTWIGSAAASAAAFATTVVSFALNKGYSDMLDANEKKWFDVFNRYYSKGGSGYRSPRAWRDKLQPIFESKTLTLNEKQQKIKEEVEKYSWQLWNNESEIAYVFNDTQTKSLKGGLNQALKTKLSNHLKSVLYNGNIKLVFEWYSKKSLRDAQAAIEKVNGRLAQALSDTVHITFKDTTRKANEDSILTGWTVRWKEIPSKIRDKKNLNLKVPKKGEVSTYHTVYAALAYKLKPVVEICAPNGEVVDTQTMVFKNKFNNYNLMTKNVKEYLLKHGPKLNKKKLTLLKGEKFKLKLKNAIASRVKWSTSSKKTASVSKSGVVKAKKIGKATIKAVYNKVTYKCSVKVKKKLKHYWKLVKIENTSVGFDNTVFHTWGDAETVTHNGSVHNGNFSASKVHNDTRDWCQDHKGACVNEYIKATASVTGYKKIYRAKEKAKLKAKMIFTTSDHYCAGNDYYTLSVYQAAKNGTITCHFKYAPSGTVIKHNITSYAIPKGSKYYKTHEFKIELSTGNDWQTGQHKLTTIYKYKWV